MDNPIYELASAVSVFKPLNPIELQSILAAGSMRKYAKDSFITMMGDIWPFLFLIVEGKLSAIKESSEGRSLLISNFEVGDLFWGTAFFYEEAVMPVSLLVREETQIYLWRREKFLPFLLNNGGMGWEFSRLLVFQMLRASNIVDGLAFQPVAGRVAQFLLEQASLNQGISPRNLTLDEMAAHIGTTREMVCRYLRSFSDEGLIEITRTEYNITDRQALMRLTRMVKG